MDRRSFLSGRSNHASTAAPEPKPKSNPKSNPAKPFAALAGLEPYTTPLTKKEVRHLLRRTCFGASDADISTLNNRLASDIVSDWIEAAPNLGPIEHGSERRTQDPGGQNMNWIYEIQARWFKQMSTNLLREKMVLFWHDHFSMEYDVYEEAPFAYQYLYELQARSLGSIEDFLYVIGLLPGMLIYLDGDGNTTENGIANENYGRELLELFSMGIRGKNGTANYNENSDIPEVARALTGYVVNRDNYTKSLKANRHDNTNKTFFGRTGNFGYNDVIDIIFEERGEAIAYNICRKLYRYFLYSETTGDSRDNPKSDPDGVIIQGMVDTMLANNYHVAPVMQQFLSSAHFYEQVFIGARIKSPLDLMVGLVREMNIPPSDAISENLTQTQNAPLVRMGQDLLNPPNVAGWPGHQSWIRADLIPERWTVVLDLLAGRRENTGYDVIDAVNTITNDLSNSELVARRLMEHLLPVDPGYPIAQSDDPNDGIVSLQGILLDGIPHYEWTAFFQGDDDVADLSPEARAGIRDRLLGYLTFLIQLPEYQLC